MSQGQFFSRPGISSVVPGFSLLREYVTSEQERSLLADVEQGAWEKDASGRIQQYGLRASDMSWVRDFPQRLLPLAKRVCHDSDFARFPESCLIRESISAATHAPHREDIAFGPIVAGVSLGSDAILELISENGRRVPIQVPARSLWILSGEARSKWLYAISPTGTGRHISIIFRTAADLQNVIEARKRLASS